MGKSLVQLASAQQNVESRFLLARLLSGIANNEFDLFLDPKCFTFEAKTRNLNGWTQTCVTNDCIPRLIYRIDETFWRIGEGRREGIISHMEIFLSD